MNGTKREPSIDRFVRVLDEAISIPGTRIKVGLDAVLGLVPGLGDLLTTLLALYPVIVAMREQAPIALIARMLVNVAVDSAIGAIPLIGDVVDVLWRANRRNAELLKRWRAEPRRTLKRTHFGFTIVAGLLVAFLALLIWGLGAGSLSLLRWCQTLR